MSAYQTVARPYAQAVFDLAQESGDFQSWSDGLALLSTVAQDPQIQGLAQNPRVDAQSLLELVGGIGGDTLSDGVRNFVGLLVANGRLLAASSIADQYEQMRAEAEGTIEATLESAMAVSEKQQARLAKALSARLGREVTLQVTENPDLVGGAVLRAGDLVVDASVRGRLEKLTATLAR